MGRGRTAFFCVLVLFAACGQEEVPGRLDAKQAVEAVIALRHAGIAAERIAENSRQGERYRISVPSKDSARALEILHELGLPRDEAARSPEALTRVDGFVPLSSELNAVRLDLVLAAQAEKLLEALPGVVEARVVVRSYLTAASAGAREAAPTASVIIRYNSASGKLPFETEDVQKIVAQTVPRLSPSAVRVDPSRVILSGPDGLLGLESSGQGSVVNLVRLTPFRFQVPEKDQETARRQLVYGLISFVVLGFLSGGYIGWVYGLRSRRRRSAQNFHAPANIGRAVSIESSSRMSEGEARSATGSSRLT